MRTLQATAFMIVVGFGISAKAPAPDGIPPDTLKAVQRLLPKGWTATAKGATLTVRRERKVGLWNPIGAPPLDGKPPTPTVTEAYEITLRFGPRVTTEGYAKLQEENETTGKKLEAMCEGLRRANITHKFDDWLPQTPEQKKLVAEYRAAQKSLPDHRLPDLYNRTHSIEIDDSVRFPLSFVSAKEAKECEGVKDSIRRLFTPYADH